MGWTGVRLARQGPDSFLPPDHRCPTPAAVALKFPPSATVSHIIPLSPIQFSASSRFLSFRLPFTHSFCVVNSQAIVSNSCFLLLLLLRKVHKAYQHTSNKQLQTTSANKQPNMRSSIIAATAVVLAGLNMVNGQTFTDCDPTKKSTSPPYPPKKQY